MNRDDVVKWVGQYERAWRDGDTEAVAALFSDDAAYRAVAVRAVRGSGTTRSGGFWLDDPGTSVLDERSSRRRRRRRRRSSVSTCCTQTPTEQEYRDLWLLRFAPDGRVADFEEWAYWPGKPYSATESPS